MTAHKNVYSALAAAQAAMGKLIKGAENPHFKSRYADLADVVEAVRGPLTDNGLTFTHYITYIEGLGTCMVTRIHHGESDTFIECPVPLIVAKNDMQGFKSACTYAKRIGLESVSGLAPEDDDGNAAAKAAPKAISSAEMKRRVDAIEHDLADCFSTVAVDALARSVRAEMDKNGWPSPAPDSDDYEHSYRRLVADKFKDRRAELERIAASQTEEEMA